MAHSTEIVTGRRIGVVLAPGDEVLSSIAAACEKHEIRQAFIPVFLGAFRSVQFIASASPIDDQEIPLKDATSVHYVEGIGSGSVTWDPASETHSVHLHVAVGVKDSSAAAYAGHLLAGITHYIAEVVIDEVLSPGMLREPDPRAHGISNLRLDGDLDLDLSLDLR